MKKMSTHVQPMQLNATKMVAKLSALIKPENNAINELMNSIMLKLSLVVLLFTLSGEAYSQDLVYDQADITTYANTSAASTLKSGGGISIQQIGTQGDATTTPKYIQINNSNSTPVLNNTSNDAVVITATSNIQKVIFTYASNSGSTQPYVGFSSTVSTIGTTGDISSTLTSCIQASTVGTTHTAVEYTCPANTKFLVMVRGKACSPNSANSTTIRISKIEVFLAPTCTAPTAFNVTGGGLFCSGGSGVSVGLDGSQSNASYQLYNGASTVGSPVAGTGSAISFGNQTAAGTYTVKTTTDGGYCAADMTGSVAVSVSNPPSTSVAGSDQTITNGNSASLSANTPASGTGVWSVLSGPSTDAGQFSNTASPTSNFTPAGGPGDYVLQWEISSAPCSPSSTSSLTLTVETATTPFITLVSAAATENQSVPINTAMDEILYSIGGGVTTATVTWTNTADPATPPTGVSVDITSTTVTISGTPSSAGSYAYTVTTDGSPAATAGGTLDVTVSSAKDITAFTIPGQVGPSVFGSNTISITMPFGTMRLGLAPNSITTSAFSTVNPAAGVGQDFRSAVIYTVTAQDNSTKDYTVTVTNQPPSCDPVTMAFINLTATSSYTFSTGDIAYANATGSNFNGVSNLVCGTSTQRTQTTSLILKLNGRSAASISVAGTSTGTGRSITNVEYSSTLASGYTAITGFGATSTISSSSCGIMTATGLNIPANSYVRLTFNGNTNVTGFTVTPVCPTVPKLTTPTVGTPDNATADGFTAHWTDISNEIGYRVDVYNSADAFVTSFETGANATSQVVSGLATNNSYYYKVTALGDGDAYANSDASAASSSVILGTVTTTLSACTTQLNFTTTGWTPSANQSCTTISGSNLSEDIHVTVGAPFQLSLNGTSGWATSVDVPRSGSSVNNATVYVRYNPSSGTGDDASTVTFSTAGATDVSFAVTGKAAPVITLSTGSNAQLVKAGTAIGNIVYTITGGVANASASGLPSGVSFNSGTSTISGTPAAEASYPAVYNYTVTVVGPSGTSNATANGTITVKDPNAKKIAYVINTAVSANDTKIRPYLNDRYDLTNILIAGVSTSSDFSSYDLVVLTEEPGSGSAGMKALWGIDKPLLNLKAFATQTNTWTFSGVSGGVNVAGSMQVDVISGAESHPVFAGVPVSGGKITMLSGVTSENGLQATTYNGTGAINLANISGGPTNIAIQEIAVGTDPSGATVATGVKNQSSQAKYLQIGISNTSFDNVTADGLKLINNAVQYLLQPAGCTGYTFTGAVNADFNNTANWECGQVPATNSTAAVQVNAPVVLSSDYSIGVGGSLTLNNGSSLTINPGTTLTIAGTANFNGQPVTVKSTSAGTGAIGSITGSLSGASNVTVERYIPNSGRKWRLLSIPVASVSPRQAFADGKAPNGSAPAGETGGYGTLITGPYANSAATATGNGFDWWAALNNPAATASIRQYTNTGATGNYNTVPNVTAPAGEQGYLLFVRGDRTVVNGSSATTLRATGQLKTGAQTVAVDVTKSHTVAGNPYAAPIDFQLVYNSNSSLIKEQCWIWDATLGGVGGYRLVKKTGGNWYGIPFNYTGTGTQDNYNRIQSGQAFFVEPAPLASSGNMNIVESHKSIGSAPNVFDAPTGTGFLFANLNQDNGSSQVLTDGAAATFGSGYQQATTDLDDVRKVSNFGENFGIVRDAVQLSLEARPQISDKDTVFFSMSGTTVRNYNLQFKAVNLQAGLTARLEDKFTGKSETIGTNDGDITTYAFSVTSAAGSAAADRFRIVFKADQTLPLTLNSARAYQQGSSAVQVDWKATNERNLRSYEVEKSLDGRSFTKASTVAAKNSSEASYSWLDATATKGLNYYRIKAISNDGTSSYSQVLLVNINNGKSLFSIYPNPAKAGKLSIQFSNMDRGQYELQLFNSVGQKILSRSIEHMGGSSSEELNLGSATAAGVYRVYLLGSNGISQLQTLVIQ